ncbi:MAG: GNAT family N-acetyltransferase [Acidimicrobiia bacterium]
MIVQGIHAAAHPDRFLVPDAQRVEPVFREWLEPGHARDWLPGQAETRGWLCESAEREAVGYVIAVSRERPETPFTSPQRWVELDQIAVRDDHRAAGAGRSLVLAVVEWARELGVDTLELTVWEFNQTAQSFFAGLGFQVIQRRQAWRIPDS